MSQDSNYKEVSIEIGQLLTTIEDAQHVKYTWPCLLTAWACLSFLMCDIIGNFVGLYGPTSWVVRAWPSLQSITLWVSPCLQFILLFGIIVPNLKLSRWQLSLLPSRSSESGTPNGSAGMIAVGGGLLGLIVFGFLVFFASEKGFAAQNFWMTEQVEASNASIYRLGEVLIFLAVGSIFFFLPHLFTPKRYFVKGDNTALPLVELNYLNTPTSPVLLRLDQSTLGTFGVLQKDYRTGKFNIFNPQNRLNLSIGHYLLLFPASLRHLFGSATTDIKSKGDFFTCQARYVIDPSPNFLGGIGRSRSFSPGTIDILRAKLFQSGTSQAVLDGLVKRALDNYVDFGIKEESQSTHGSATATSSDTASITSANNDSATKVPPSEANIPPLIDQKTATAHTFKEMFQRLEGDAKLAKAKAINTSLPTDLTSLDASTLFLARTNLDKSIESMGDLRKELQDKAKLWHSYRLRRREARSKLAEQFEILLLQDLNDGNDNLPGTTQEMEDLIHFIGLKLEIQTLDFTPGYAAESEEVVIRIDGQICEELEQAHAQAETRLESLLSEEKKRQDKFFERITEITLEFGPVHTAKVVDAFSRLNPVMREHYMKSLENASPQEQRTILGTIVPRQSDQSDQDIM